MKGVLQISVIVADAQPVFRLGMKSLLSTFPHLEVAGEAANTRELQQLSLRCRPDILILGYHPAFFNSAQLNQILLRWPECNTIVLADPQNTIHRQLTQAFPCHCMLPKECDGIQIHHAILSALQQNANSPTPTADGQLQSMPENGASLSLSQREVEIIRLVARGKTNKEIAAHLNLSHHTIHSHRKNILKKLGVRSALELTTYALKLGILQIENQ